MNAYNQGGYPQSVGLTSTGKTNNIVQEADFQRAAVSAMTDIAGALGKSVGYYGSTTIIEDAIMGHKITKDGYTILKSLRFDPSQPISNTILRFIQGISKTLVMEVGDGSTSSVLTSKELFSSILAFEQSDDTNYPRKEILDTLDFIRKDIEEELRQAATPITDDNIDYLRDIVTVSNNNDAKSGDLVFQALREVGKTGYVRLADSFNGEDFFEVSQGMELKRGYYDEAYATQGSMTLDFKNPNILIFRGVLDNSDEAWFTGFMGYYFQKTQEPLVVIADGYEKSFNDLIKINKRNNERQGMILDIALIAANSTRPEESEDVAIYTGTQLLDKQDPETGFLAFKTAFESNDALQIHHYLDDQPYFGKAKQMIIGMNDTTIVEGKYDPDNLSKRVDEITKMIEYYESLSAKMDVEGDAFKYRQRLSNIQSKMATIYISGSSEVEKETRKYLFEDAVYAGRSALQNGFISGGCLGVSKAIKRIKKKKEENKPLITSYKPNLYMKLLDAVDHAFRITYRTVLSNYGQLNNKEISKCIDECISEDKIFNLTNFAYEADSETTIINSVQTDISIMKTTFSIIGLLVSSNQYIGKI